ncbi:sigma-70 family RNA polymerase sigma factor [Candidatus Carsonella ruddii]|uniref:sigma-70 family RNA polymerase sigma factor n=1 Tax=Carsonella ruddii TaxID=114186 RepID=UPI00247A3BC4|nr:sigma-70 family RNA polymerase sigma factor [Candidatus Carsonella ruddii]WGS66736.1 sigma-70 family RNA polymerase sigma factor [Candidatus Carsonella ruddii]
MNLNFFLKKKNIKLFIKKISKKFLKIFKNNINKKYKINCKKYLILKKINVNLQKKKKKIYNLINYILLNNYIIRKFLIKSFFFLKKIIFKKNSVTNIFSYLYFRKINFYLNKIKLKNSIDFFEKKLIFIKNNLLILKNKLIIFKKKIKQKINLNNLNTINYLFLIKNKINEKIILNNVKIVQKIIKKHKKKPFFNDLFQECYLEFKKIINNNLLSKKNFFKLCYWKMKKIMIRIINSKKNKKNTELVSIDKPLFNYTIKYFLSEKERSFLIEFARNALKNIIRSLILNLPKKEQKIIRLRFGIGVIRNYTLEEIGRLCNLTRERIRQLELNIIIKIRQPEILRILKPFIKILKSLE